MKTLSAKTRNPSGRPSSIVAIFAAAICLPLFFGLPAFGHGMGHSHGPSNLEHSEHTHDAAVVDGDGTEALTDFAMESRRERLWGANLSTFWESKHIHYGVTEADGSSVYGTELGIAIQNFSLGASGIFALENDFTEWNFTAAYTVEAGPVFLTPGFNLRWNPSYADSHGAHGTHQEDEHENEHDDEHEEDHQADHDDHDSHEGNSHIHREFGYELFIVVGTTAIPYVTPSVGFLWDLADGSGGFMEIRLDGDIPLYKDIVSLAPYTSLGLNFGYNTHEYYGWNNFQYGVNLNVSLTRNITIYGGVGQNVAFQAASDADSGNEVYATTGISFGF